MLLYRIFGPIYKPSGVIDRESYRILLSDQYSSVEASEIAEKLSQIEGVTNSKSFNTFDGNVISFDLHPLAISAITLLEVEHTVKERKLREWLNG